MSDSPRKPPPMGSVPTMAEIEALPDRQQSGKPVTNSVSAGWSGRKQVSKEVDVPHKEGRKPR